MGKGSFGKIAERAVRYGRLLGVFLKMSLMSQLEYRANFAAGVAVETGWMLIKLLYVAVIYRAGTNIGVLTPDHILLFIGVYVLLTGVYMLYYGNFTSLSTMVREGQLDMYMVKPVSLQFLVTLQKLDISLLLPDFVAGRDDRDRLAAGGASGYGRGGCRLYLLSDLRLPADLQPVSFAESAGILDDGDAGHRGADRRAVGFQQHAADDLWKVDAAHRHVSPANLRDHQLSGTVPHGGTHSRDDGMGRAFPDTGVYHYAHCLEKGN